MVDTSLAVGAGPKGEQAPTPESGDPDARAAGDAAPVAAAPARGIVSRLPYRIGRARDALLGKFRPILADHGLTDSQWRVLRVLSSVEALDAGDTAQRAFLLPSSLSRILKDLNQRGLIVSWSPPDDARRSRHALSPVGRKLIADIEPHLLLVRQDIEQRFGTDRLRDLSALLDAFADALES